MNRMRFCRPSPALVISIVALVVASTGTAVAVTKITSSKQIGKNVVNSGDIRDKTLQVRDTSRKLRKALAGKKGAPGATGQKGDPGQPGSALAYAHVFASGDVEEANSKNVSDANVSHGSLTGYFCFNLPFSVKSVVANVDLSYQDTGFATVDLGDGGGGCPASTQVSVKTTIPTGGEFDDFFVVFN
jgi:hypothetical protein